MRVSQRTGFNDRITMSGEFANAALHAFSVSITWRC
jgi:hypothetical protein